MKCDWIVFKGNHKRVLAPGCPVCGERVDSGGYCSKCNEVYTLNDRQAYWFERRGFLTLKTECPVCGEKMDEYYEKIEGSWRKKKSVCHHCETTIVEYED